MQHTATTTPNIGPELSVDGSHQRVRTYGGLGLPPPKKGHLFLPRLKATLPFESLIEEQVLVCLDADLSVCSIIRAPSITHHDATGTVHTYTADYQVERESAAGHRTTVTYECKPSALLRGIICNEPLNWQLRAEKLKAADCSLWIVTDRDIEGSRFEHAQSFGVYFHSVAQPHLRNLILTELQAGPLTKRDLIDRVQLRVDMPLQTSRWQLQLHDTLYGLVARGEIHADQSVSPDDLCPFWLSTLSVPTTLKPLGAEIAHYIHRSYSGWEEDSAVAATLQPDEHHRLAEHAFLKSERGKQYLNLFSRYSDPRVPLDADLIEELKAATTFSERALYRFKKLLHLAGAPGITFQQLVPYLKTEQRAPSNIIQSEVKVIMEDLVTSSYLNTVGSGKTQRRSNTVSDLHVRIRKACLEAKLPPPARTTIKRYLDALYLQDPVGFTLARDGTEAVSKLVGRQGGAAANHYGELLGVDCTLCDVFTLKDSMELRVSPWGKPKKASARSRAQMTERATMVMITEESTSEIVLSYLIRGKASGAAILDGLRRVMLGERTLQEAAGVEHFTPFEGLPLKIRMDSGSEFANQHVRRAMQSLGITVVRRNKGTRHTGGLEERTIGTLVRTHHILPGSTMNNIKARGQYDAQNGATLSFELLSAFQQLNVEQHNLDCAPRQGISRHEHARELIRTGKVKLRQPSPEQRRYLHEQMLPVEWRTCGREGIKMFGLRFISQTAEMEHLIRQKAEVEVVYKLEDLRSIQLVQPTTGLLLTLNALPYPGVNFDAPLPRGVWDEFRQHLNGNRAQLKDKKQNSQQVLDRLLDQHRQNTGAASTPVTNPAPPNQVLPTPAPETQSSEIQGETGIALSPIKFILKSPPGAAQERKTP